MMAVRPGTWFVLPTAFDDKGRLDLDSQRQITEASIDWGVDGVTALGIMGEAHHLEAHEREDVIRATVSAAAGHIPVAVGCSASALVPVQASIAIAKNLGADACMVAPPTLLRNLDTLPDFFAKAADGGLPLIIQDEPTATGVVVPASMLVTCAVASGATWIKLEDPPTPIKIARLLELDPRLVVFGGLGGVAALSELRRGAAGTMTGFAFPEVLRAVRIGIAGGAPGAAATVFDHYLPLIQFEAQFQIGIAIRKELLRRRGVLRHAFSRAVPAGLDSATITELAELLDRLEIDPSSFALPIS